MERRAMPASPTLDALCEEGAVHARAAAAARRNLAAARIGRGDVLRAGRKLRQEVALSSAVIRVRTSLEACGNRNASDELLRNLGRLRTLDAAPEVARLRGQLRKALNAALSDWIAQEAEVFFAGARALSLLPPGELSSGVDGLERERTAHQTVARLFEVAAEADRDAAQCGGDSAAYECRNILCEEASRRLAEGLAVASRLATQAGNADPEVALLAFAEAAGAAGKAARSVSSGFGALPPAAADDDALDSEDAALLKALADQASALLERVNALDTPPSGSSWAAAAAELGALAKRHRAAAAELVRACQTSRGRRALGRVAEATESIEQAALERRS